MIWAAGAITLSIAALNWAWWATQYLKPTLLNANVAVLPFLCLVAGAAVCALKGMGVL